MKSEEWKTYRTRFLVKSKQLSSALSFVDHLGRQHCGRKGDYLVESFDGVLSIAPRRIFEDIYVPMSEPDAPNSQAPHTETTEPKLSLNFEALEIEQLKLPRTPSARRRDDEALIVQRSIVRTGSDRRNGNDRRHSVPQDAGRPEESARVRSRKLPQPCRVNPSGSRLGLM